MAVYWQNKVIDGQWNSNQNPDFLGLNPRPSYRSVEGLEMWLQQDDKSRTTSFTSPLSPDTATQL